MSVTAPVTTGSTFVASIPVPPGPPVGLGARIETPVIGAIVSAFQPADILTATANVTLEAPPTAGGYIVHWMTGSDPSAYDAYQPLTVVGTLASTTIEDWPDVDPDQVRPDIDDIELLERTRTVDQTTGQEVGEFTTNTRPTAAQVESIIDEAVDDVLAELRPQLDPSRYRQLRKVIALYAAMLIEGSFFGEQVREQGGTIMWSTEYNEALKNLQARVEQDISEHNLLGTMEPRDTAILA